MPIIVGGEVEGVKPRGHMIHWTTLNQRPSREVLGEGRHARKPDMIESEEFLFSRVRTNYAWSEKSAVFAGK